MNNPNHSNTQTVPTKLLQKDTLDITVVGAGFSGLKVVYKALRAGHKVTLFGKDKQRLREIKQGKLPLKRRGWQEEFDSALAKDRLSVVLNLDPLEGDQPVVFICVNTVPEGDGSIDIGAIHNAIKEVRSHLDKAVMTVLKTWLPFGAFENIKESHELSNLALNLQPPYYVGNDDMETTKLEAIAVESWWEEVLLEKVFGVKNMTGEAVISLDKEEIVAGGYALSELNEAVRKIESLCSKRKLNSEVIATIMDEFFSPYMVDYQLHKPKMFLDHEPKGNHDSHEYPEYLTLKDLTDVFDRSYGRLSHWISEVNLGEYSDQEFEHKFTRESLRSFVDNELRSTGWFDDVELNKFKERIEVKFSEKVLG